MRIMNKILYSCTVLFLSFLFTISVSAQSVQWGITIGTTSSEDITKDLGFDTQGNLILVGNYKDHPLTIDTFTLQFNSSQDIYFTKLNPQGAVQWARRLGSSFPDDGVALKCDKDNYFSITGTYSTVGSAPLSLHANDAFIQHFDPSGNTVWNKTFLGDISCHGMDVAVDNAGNVFGVGNFTTKIYFETNDTLQSWGGYDFYLVKYEPSGNFQWANKLGGTGNELFPHVATDGLKTIAVAGAFKGDFHFDWAQGLTQSDSVDGFVAMYDEAGVFQNGFRIGGPGIQSVEGISFGPEGDLYVTGYFTDSISVGQTGLFSGTSQKRSFFLRVGQDGTVKWIKAATGPDWNSATGIVVSDAGKVYVSGINLGMIQIDTVQANPTGSVTSSFVAVLDTSGLAIELQVFSGQFGVGIVNIDCDRNDAWAVCGQLQGYMDLFNGDSLYTISAQHDGFAFKKCPAADLSIHIPGDSILCTNSTLVVNWNPEGCFNTGNQFIFELSDSNGVFSSPVYLDTISAIYPPQSFYLTIPAGTNFASGYRIRARSTQPAITGPDNGYDLVIAGSTGSSISISGNTIICPHGNPITLSATAGFTSYLWSNGSQSNTTQVTSPGNYWVNAVDASGCGLSATVLVDECVRIEHEIAGRDFLVYPNPAKNRVVLQSHSGSEFSGSLLSSEGKLLITQKGENEIEFDLQHLPAGLYFLRVEGNSGVEVFKIIHLQ